MPRNMKALCQEAALWKMTKSANVLGFIGLYEEKDDQLGGRIALVSLWMKNGNLKNYVQINKGADRPKLVCLSSCSSTVTGF